MNNFNYNNYIGDHMSEPLRVVFSFVDDENKIGILTGLNMDYLILSAGPLEDIQQYSKLCKPKIKSILDLTDEEFVYIAGEGSSVLLDKELTCIFKNGKAIIYLYGDGFFELKGGTDLIYAQQLLNRLYSLHVALNAKELIRNGLAVRKE